jgi:hypothetical protein
LNPIAFVGVVQQTLARLSEEVKRIKSGVQALKTLFGKVVAFGAAGYLYRYNKVIDRKDTDGNK